MADNNIYEDILVSAKTIDITDPILPQDRSVHRDLLRLTQVEYQNATLAAVDEVQSISAGDRADGTFEIDFTLVDGTTFTTDPIDHDGTAAAIQLVVDAAAVLEVDGYVAGDIVAAGGPLATSPVTLTFSGNSVRGNHPLAVVVDIDLSGGTTDPAITQSTAGVVPRFWFAALKAMGCITGTDPAFAAAPNGDYEAVDRNTLAGFPSQETIESLIHEATVQEGQDWDSELLPLFGYRKLVEHLRA
jgi:hypothetical protein